MSFRPKNVRRRKTAQHTSSRAPSAGSSLSGREPSRSASPSKHTSYIPLRTTQDARRAYSSRLIPIVAPAGIVFTARGRQSRTAASTLPASSLASSPTQSQSSALRHSISRATSPSSEFPLFTDEHDYDSDPEDPVVPRHVIKHTSQWVTWTTLVIPGMVDHYLRLLRKSESLQDVDFNRRLRCSCGDVSGRNLNVLCIHFDGMFFLPYVTLPAYISPGIRARTFRTCRCLSAPNQLVTAGLFPCAPVAPTLAVDLKLLEFTRQQFLFVAPNMTGWCDALETFLSNLSFKLTTRVKLFLSCLYLRLLTLVTGYIAPTV